MGEYLSALSNAAALDEHYPARAVWDRGKKLRHGITHHCRNHESWFGETGRADKQVQETCEVRTVLAMSLCDRYVIGSFKGGHDADKAKSNLLIILD